MESKENVTNAQGKNKSTDMNPKMIKTLKLSNRIQTAIIAMLQEIKLNMLESLENSKFSRKNRSYTNLEFLGLKNTICERKNSLDGLDCRMTMEETSENLKINEK
jgi:hypothetical protein